MRPSRPLVQTVSGQARHRLRRSDVPRPSAANVVLLSSVALSRPGSGRGGRLPPLDAGLLRSAVEPASGLANAPLRSPPSPPHQTASPASLPFAPAPWSLADSQPPPTSLRTHPPAARLPATKATQDKHASASDVVRPPYPARTTKKGYKHITRGSSGWRRCSFVDGA